MVASKVARSRAQAIPRWSRERQDCDPPAPPLAEREQQQGERQQVQQPGDVGRDRQDPPEKVRSQIPKAVLSSCTCRA
jgi:hypothetical protein